MGGIRFTYGTRQRFRRRLDVLTLRGEADSLRLPVRRAEYALNGSGGRPFHVETIPDDGVDWIGGYKPTPSELRCRRLGEIVVEIPADDPALRAGANEVVLSLEDAAGLREERLRLDFDPEPPSLPLDLSDLSAHVSVQEIGEVVNGAFDLDPAANVIRSRGPVAPDALLVLGPPAASQEATYAVRFLDLAGAKWLGLSDFFAGMVEGAPPRGLRVGWSSAGMAVVTPRGEARSFLAWGDHSGRPEEWAIATHPPAPVRVERGRPYRVRHRVTFAGGVNSVTFRIWPAGEAEPKAWLCHEHDGRLPAHLPRHRAGCFALFQHMGHPIEWSDIRVRAIDPLREPLPTSVPGREPFLGRARPGAF